VKENPMTTTRSVPARTAGVVLAAPGFLLALVLATSGCAPKDESVTVTTDTTATVPGGDAVPAPAPDSATRAAGARTSTMPVEPTTPPEHIEVQHVLIAFEGKVPGKVVTRSQAAAEKLAQEILERARNGEDFDELVRKYTDDQWPGIYGLSNRGIDPVGGEIARDGMVKGFSDVSFSLSPGNVGMTAYDPKTSPYGWHIIKRLK
jgi:hypothetical protein